MRYKKATQGQSKQLVPTPTITMPKSIVKYEKQHTSAKQTIQLHPGQQLLQ